MSLGTALPPRSWSVAGAALGRGLAWTILIGATAVLVRDEARRPALPEGITAHTDLVYRRVDGRRVRLDVYLAPEAASPPTGRPAIVAIHGGGWRGGSKDEYGPTVAPLARHGYVVVAVDYLLSRPGAPSWPGNIEDIREAVRWVRRHARDYGIDPTRIVAMGASAGGHLAALLGTDPEGQEPRRDPPGRTSSVSARVQAVVDFYGPADLRALQAVPSAARTSVALYLGGTPAEVAVRYLVASPVRHVSRDDPPVLLIHGSDDALVPPAQSEALASALTDAGVAHRLIVVAEARHGFGFQVGRRDLVPDILAFLDDAWHSGRGEVPGGKRRVVVQRPATPPRSTTDVGEQTGHWVAWGR